MTQNELFWTLLIVVILLINGARELAKKNYPLAALFFAIPICGVIARMFGASP